MKLSPFGERFLQGAAIVELMDDLGEALNSRPDALFLGGGNPACVPKAQAIFSDHLQRLAHLPPHELLGIYQSTSGNVDVLEAIAGYLQSHCGWSVGPENLSLVGGSQTAFFILLNAFAGDGRKVLLPVVPEYLGYEAQVLEGAAFVPVKPIIHIEGDHRFKYELDAGAIGWGESIGAACISSPTNPSGKVHSYQVLTQLAQSASDNKVPLIVDYAYGLPIPGVVYGEEKPFWRDDVIAVMSLSKLGLPGVRCSVVVASPEVAKLVSNANTMMSLAGGNLGPALLKSLIDSGDINCLTQDILPAFYLSQRDVLVNALDQELAGTPYRLHEPEGAFFVWLWLPELKTTSQHLYQALKAKGVIVMPGESFFFGLENEWPHAQQCVRLTYCQSPRVLTQAAKIIAQTIKEWA